MNMIKEVLQSFQENNIQVWEKNGKVKFSGPKDKITNEFISILKENKESLIEYFASQKDTESKTVSTKNQMALWIERKLGSMDGTIHNGMIKVISGSVDYINIKKAFINVMNRHEALRSTFYEETSEVYITVDNINDNFFHVEDLSFMTMEDACLYAKNRMNETMSLNVGPLFQVAVYTVSECTHIVALWAHHVISDAYSLFIIEKEFYQFYDEIVNGCKHQLDNINSYLDCIMEEQKYLKSKQYIEDIEYWKGYLDKTVKGSSLPKYKMQSLDNYHYRAETFIDIYSKELSFAIRTSARECQTTVYMLVVAIFNLALNKFSEGRKTSLGMFASNRLKEEHRSMVGYFSNALVFQHEVDDKSTVLQYVKQIKTQILQMLSHQQTPFTCLVSEINPNREERNPFFSVAFDSLLFTRDEQTEELQKKLNIAEYDLVKGSGEYDFIVWISENDGCYSLEYRYNSQLFDKYQIETFAETLKGMLSIVCGDNNMLLSQIPLIFGKSKEIIDDINRTQVNYNELLVYDIIRKQCSEKKEKVAISCGNEAISYEEMEALISHISKWLKEAGVQKGNFVGIMLEKSCYLIPAILSVWSIGAVYVPIDPHFPASRKEYIITNTNLSAILIEQKLKNSMNTNVAEISIDDIVIEWNVQHRKGIDNVQDLYSIVEADLPAYVLYTSGSTGNPKGVIISHSAFMNFLNYMVQKISIVEDDKLLALTSICFDISLLEMFLPLMVGAGIVMTTHDEALDGSKILRCIKENSVTIMQATPPSYQILYDFYERETSLEGLLRSCLCGGQSYELDLVDKMQKMSKKVFNVYGPTETTIWSTVYEFPRPCTNITIGNPIANTKVIISNQLGQPLPLGISGELLIGGKGIFKGYFNNKEMTEHALIELSDGEIYYKTGDWAYFNEEGNLKFLGRRDSQVKIRGFRIELSEIENVFRKYEDILRVAAVMMQQNESHSLAVVVVPKDNVKLDTNLIMQFIKKYLPEYMLPSHILVIDELPMTANGKVCKKTIVNMINNLNKDDAKAEIVEESHLEKQIKSIWENVLNKHVNSINIGFFEAGGNSLLLNKLVVKFEMEFKHKIDIIKLLKYNTIKRMANYISNDEMEKNKTVDNNKEYVNRRGEYLKSRKR